MTQEAITPRALKCPITQQTFNEPVLAPDGHTYEKAALDQWDKHSKGLSPVTGQPMANLPRVQNATLARALADFREHRHQPGSQRDEWKRHTESSISYEPLTLPVRLSDGHDYNQDEAVHVIGATGRSPFAAQAFEDTEVLRPNLALQTLSADVHGLDSPAYPELPLRIERLLPPAPMNFEPPDVVVMERILTYVRGPLLRGEPLDDVETLPVLKLVLKSDIAGAAVILKQTIDAIVAKERRSFGVPFMFEGARLWNWALPKPVEKLVSDASSHLHAIVACVSALSLNGAEDITINRFVEACAAFLAPRHDIGLLSAKAGLRASIAGGGLIATSYGLGWFAGSPWCSIANQGILHGATLGVFLAERAIILAKTHRPVALRDAQRGQVAPSWALTAASLVTRGGSMMAAAAGAGAALAMVLPVGWVTSDAEQHYPQVMAASCVLSAALVMAPRAAWLLSSAEV